MKGAAGTGRRQERANGPRTEFVRKRPFSPTGAAADPHKAWSNKGPAAMVQIGIVGVGFMGMIHYLKMTSS